MLVREVEFDSLMVIFTILVIYMYTYPAFVFLNQGQVL